MKMSPFMRPKYLYTSLIHLSEQEMSSETIEFSRKVDSKGRLVIPQDIRQALTIDDREALVKFSAEKVTYLDEDDTEGSA